MRAVAVFPEDKAVRLIDHPEPAPPGPREARVQILDVGVCGTDREIAHFDYGTPPPDSRYLVLGHESLGRVLEVGSGVKRLKPGDLVITTVRRPCRDERCSACRVGRQDFCFTGNFTERGIKEVHGFMTEQIVDDERYMHPVPSTLREVGVLVEPLTIAEKALRQVGEVQSRMPWLAEGSANGQRALVLGAGPVGLLGALALLVRGYETWVYSTTPAGSEKPRWVESVGARYIAAETSTPLQAAKQIGNIDLVYEATGVATVSFETLEVLGVNGSFVLTGVPGRKHPITCNAASLMKNLVLKNQLVFGTVNAGPDAFAAAIDGIETFQRRWPDAVRGLITQRVPPEEHAELLLGRPSGIKRVVRFAE